MEKETGRIEAFSDGVFAIAITLLILEIKVPELEEGHSLAQALGAQWPSYGAFLISFATIGIMWINHHRMFTYIHKTDHTLLILNLLCLLTITFIPFPTSLIADYFARRDAMDIANERTAAMVYNGSFIAMAVLFNRLWAYASSGNRLLGAHVDARAVADITRAYRFGPLIYIVMFVVGLLNVPVSLALNILLALFYALPGRQPKAAPSLVE